jgi:hypothetical protein
MERREEKESKGRERWGTGRSEGEKRLGEIVKGRGKGRKR